ncbi:hypothetical protein HPB52_022454 [Rhipicephalus sanguineus]|uniref:Uncharacterized protein n=1 Tax=Rhipicephalus sanguineus TaxID=34632 RepID=A0A9D4Q5Z1_RHISA|nr:hypothetical protein HPB52_022454 [Rhipicephalus sanguineus]
MSTNRKSRKRYLEPAARNDSLPRSTLHEIRKRALPSSAEPDSNVNSGTPTATADRPESPYSRCGSEPAEDTSDYSYPSIVEDESTASDGESPCAESSSAQPTNTFASSSFFRMEFQRPIGSGNKLSVGDALVLAIDFAIKHGLTWTAIEDLLKYSNQLLGTDVLPDSKYLFRKFSGASPEEMNFFFYCPECHRLLAKTGGSLEERYRMAGTCCGKYYTGDTLRQELYESVSSKHRENENIADAMTDLTDGAFYKKQRQTLGCRNGQKQTSAPCGGDLCGDLCGLLDVCAVRVRIAYVACSGEEDGDRVRGVARDSVTSAWAKPEPYLLVPRRNGAFPLREDRARNRVRGRAKPRRPVQVGTIRVRAHEPKASTVERVPWAQSPGINGRGTKHRATASTEVYARRRQLGNLIGSDGKLYATASLFRVAAITTCSDSNMDLEKLTAVGIQLGLTGAELSRWIEAQQAKQRDERAAEREALKEAAEIARLPDERQREILQLKLQLQEGARNVPAAANDAWPGLVHGSWLDLPVAGTLRYVEAPGGRAVVSPMDRTPSEGDPSLGIRLSRTAHALVTLSGRAPSVLSMRRRAEGIQEVSSHPSQHSDLEHSASSEFFERVASAGTFKMATPSLALLADDIKCIPP